MLHVRGPIHCRGSLCSTISRIPAVVTNDYEPKGEFKAFGGYDKEYFTGPTNTGKVRLLLQVTPSHSTHLRPLWSSSMSSGEHLTLSSNSNSPDNSFSNTCLQGADIVASSTQSLVIIPDYFRGTARTSEHIPIDTEEKKKAYMEWSAAIGDPLAHIEGSLALIAELKKDGAQKVGMVGYCWGASLWAR